MPLLEVHLFDREEELYGQHLRVRFLEKLREGYALVMGNRFVGGIAPGARRAR